MNWLFLSSGTNSGNFNMETDLFLAKKIVNLIKLFSDYTDGNLTAFPLEPTRIKLLLIITKLKKII